MQRWRRVCLPCTLRVMAVANLANISTFYVRHFVLIRLLSRPNSSLKFCGVCFPSPAPENNIHWQGVALYGGWSLNIRKLVCTSWTFHNLLAHIKFEAYRLRWCPASCSIYTNQPMREFTLPFYIRIRMSNTTRLGALLNWTPLTPATSDSTRPRLLHKASRSTTTRCISTQPRWIVNYGLHKKTGYTQNLGLTYHICIHLGI